MVVVNTEISDDVKRQYMDMVVELNTYAPTKGIEMSIIKNILATNERIKDISLSKLQGQCVEEVKRINGVLSTEEAIKWQN